MSSDLKTPRIVFRVDGGRIARVSLGHVFRCLALARELEARGADCQFLMRADPRGPAVVRERGFAVTEVAADAAEDLEAWRRALHELDPDLVAIDLLRPQPETLRALRFDGRPQLVLDDLGGFAAVTDLIVNGSAVSSFQDYGPGPARLLLGPDFMVLGPEFRGRSEPRIAPRLGRIRVTMGGSDPAGMAMVVLTALSESISRHEVTFMAGPAFAAGPGGRERLDLMKTQFRVQENVPDLSMSLMDADLVVSAGGRTAYELAALGVPALVIPTCEHEIETARALAEQGTCLAVSGCDPEQVRAEIGGLLEELGDQELRRKLSRAGRRLIDGRGGERIAAEMLGFTS